MGKVLEVRHVTRADFTAVGISDHRAPLAQHFINGCNFHLHERAAPAEASLRRPCDAK